MKSSRAGAGSWEPVYRQLSWSGLSELDYCRQSGSHFLRELNVLWQVSGHEFWDQSLGSISFGSWGHCGCQSSWSRFTVKPICCGLTWQSPRGKDRSGQDQTLSVHTVTATDGADTTDRGSSVNRTHGTAAASGTVGTDQADMVWVVSMTMHTAGNTGSQSTQLPGPSQQQVPQPVIQNCRTEECRPSHKNSYQFSLQCQLMTEIQRCPLFPYWLWQVCIIHTAWWCPLLAWMCSTDHQTWQLRWEPATCNSKCRTSIGSNHHSLVRWTSRCCFPHGNLCSSPQLLLVHRASRPGMLSPCRQPCGRWWIPFYNNSSIWFILAIDLEHLGHLFTRMQAHPDARVGWLHIGFQHLLHFIPCRQGCHGSCFHGVSGRKDNKPDYD